MQGILSLFQCFWILIIQLLHINMLASYLLSITLLLFFSSCSDSREQKWKQFVIWWWNWSSRCSKSLHSTTCVSYSWMAVESLSKNTRTSEYILNPHFSRVVFVLFFFLSFVRFFFEIWKKYFPVRPPGNKVNTLNKAIYHNKLRQKCSKIINKCKIKVYSFLIIIKLLHDWKNQSRILTAYVELNFNSWLFTLFRLIDWLELNRTFTRDQFDFSIIAIIIVYIAKIIYSTVLQIIFYCNYFYFQEVDINASYTHTYLLHSCCV